MKLTSERAIINNAELILHIEEPTEKQMLFALWQCDTGKVFELYSKLSTPTLLCCMLAVRRDWRCFTVHKHLCSQLPMRFLKRMVADVSAIVGLLDNPTEELCLFACGGDEVYTHVRTGWDMGQHIKHPTPNVKKRIKEEGYTWQPKDTLTVLEEEYVKQLSYIAESVARVQKIKKEEVVDVLTIPVMSLDKQREMVEKGDILKIDPIHPKYAALQYSYVKEYIITRTDTLPGNRVAVREIERWFNANVEMLRRSELDPYEIMETRRLEQPHKQGQKIKMTPAQQLMLVKVDGRLIKYIQNPTFDAQMLAVKTEYAIQYISNPAPLVQYSSVKDYPISTLRILGQRNQLLNLVYYLGRSAVFSCPQFRQQSRENWENLDIAIWGLPTSVKRDILKSGGIEEWLPIEMLSESEYIEYLLNATIYTRDARISLRPLDSFNLVDSVNNKIGLSRGNISQKFIEENMEAIISKYSGKQCWEMFYIHNDVVALKYLKELTPRDLTYVIHVLQECSKEGIISAELQEYAIEKFGVYGVRHTVNLLPEVQRVVLRTNPEYLWNVRSEEILPEVLEYMQRVGELPVDSGFCHTEIVEGEIEKFLEDSTDVWIPQVRYPCNWQHWSRAKGMLDLGDL